MRLVSLVIALLAFSFVTARAQQPAPEQPGEQPAAQPSDPTTDIQTNAPFALLMDYETGTVVFSKNGDQPMAPASMAKLMTVAILFEKLKHGDLRLDDTFTVS